MTPKSWDDIDICGLSMDTPSKSPGSAHRQRHERITCQDLTAIVLEQTRTIHARVENLTAKKIYSGTVLDVSVGGVKISIDGECDGPDILRLSFKLGKRQVVCRARVVWSRRDGQQEILGLEFIKPAADDSDYIRSLISAKYLR